MKKRLKHCRKPKGKLGEDVLEDMNEHHSELIKWGLNFFSVKPNFLILDIGCGGGYMVSQLASKITNGKIYGIDYSKLSVKYSKDYCQDLIRKNKVEIKEASVSELPFENNKFNIITAVETFYFWPDKINDLKEIYRVIKPEGEFIIINEMYIDDNDKIEEKKAKWAELGEFEVYTINEMKNFLKEAGFRNIRVYEDKNNGWVTIVCKKT